MAVKNIYISDIDPTKQFETEAEQLAFDAVKRNETQIEAFLDEHFPSKGPKGGPVNAIARRVLATAIGVGFLVLNDGELNDGEMAGE